MILEHKGYRAQVEFDDEDGIFFGRLVGINDSVSFHGETAPELRAAFREAVDDYVQACGRIGKEPEKPSLENPTD